MYSSLFRHQAVAYKADRLNGDVMVLPPASMVYITMTLALWLVAVLAWLVSSEYARKVTVRGWLEPSAGVIQVHSTTSSGRIAEVAVTEGQRVEAGDVLVKLQGDQILDNGASLQHTLFQEYEHQSRLVAAQLERLQRIHSARSADISEQIDAVKAEQASLQQQQLIMAERKQLHRQRSAKLEGMRRDGHLSRIDAESARETMLSLVNQYQGLEREQLTLQSRLSQLQKQREILPQEQYNEQARLRSQLSTLTQKLTQIAGQRVSVIRASISGTITNLQARAGQSVHNNLPFMSIVPEHSHIEAKLLVPVKAAGFLAKGQALELRYDAFPYQKFGIYEGEVAHISRSVILPSEIHGNLTPINEPVYTIKALLHDKAVNAYGEPIALKPGMTLQADVRLGKRSLLEWLLEPLATLRGLLT